MVDSSHIHAFLNGDRQLTLPFDLPIGSTIFTMTDTLRLLPAKRVVFAAETVEWGKVVIKLFALDQKGKRELAREQTGHKLAMAAGVNVAPLLACYDEVAGCSAIVYGFLAQAKALKIKKSIFSSKQQKIRSLFKMIAQLHKYGVYQDDIHPDNILQQAGEIYLIDLGSVRYEAPGKALSKQKSLENLALLLAQFKPNKQDDLVAILPDYYQARGWYFNAVEKSAFNVVLQRRWQKRKQKFLAKQFRETTATVYYKSPTLEYAFDRGFWAGLPLGFVAQIDDYLAKGDVLKDGNSATVVRVELAGRLFVIKRYNIKGKRHFLRRCFRSSRAAISWRNAHLLTFIGIRTPTPQGFIEKRVASLRSTAYFISSYQAADEMKSVYERRLPRRKEIKRLKQLFFRLERDLISHGDLKAQNLLLDKKGGIILIDLDAMQQHAHCKSYIPRAQKDWQRFMDNWQDPETAVMLRRIKRK
jgi:tRNA A-37 threonylcarbamoyl transferase component Bud32